MSSPATSRAGHDVEAVETSRRAEHDHMRETSDAWRWSAQAHAAWDRWGQTGDQAELDRAITSSRAAVALLGPNSPERPESLYHLLCCLHARLEAVGGAADLDEAIRVGGELVELDPRHSDYLTIAAVLHHHRYKLFDDPAELEQAISLGQSATALPPHESSDGTSALNNLAVAIESRYDLYGSTTDLEDAIGLHQTSLALSPPGSSRKGSLHNLAGAFCKLFEARGTPESLESAVGYARRAVNARPRDGRDQSKCLSVLADALVARSEQTGAPEDLDEAIACARAACDMTPADHPDREQHLAHLVEALIARSELTDGPEDIEEAVDLAGAHVTEANPAPDGSKPGALLLMLALLSRYRWDASISHLDEAIAEGWQASEWSATPSAMSMQQTRTLSELLYHRFRHAGALSDLNAAIDQRRTVLGRPGNERRTQPTDLSSLGMYLWERYVHMAHAPDLDEAVTLNRTAVANARHAADRAMCLANLGAVLSARFDRDHLLSDLDESISVTRTALAIDRNLPEHQAGFLANLTSAHVRRFDVAHEPADLEEAIAHGLRCMELVDERNPERAKFLRNLGRAYAQRSLLSADPTADRDAAVEAVLRAWNSEAAPTRHRIMAAQEAAELLKSSAPHRAVDLMVAAVQMLPASSPRRLTRDDQQRELRGAGALAAEAASLVLADERYPEQERPLRALSLLELGRAVLIGQSLEGRDDLSDLRASRPDLAARFVELRDLLDQPVDTVHFSSSATRRQEVPVGNRSLVRDRPRLTTEFESLLSRIRAMKGFEAFGRPPAPDELLDAAQEGPVVVLTISEYGGHALLITPTGVTAMALDDLDVGVAGEMFDAFQQARETINRDEDSERRRAAVRAFDRVLEWLWDSVTRPVLDTLDLLEEPATGSDGWPRVCWVPCGILSALPVHAAGYHATSDAGNGPQAVIDCVVSSYAPSVRLLLHTRQRAEHTAPLSKPRALGIAMPATPGLLDDGRLPYVAGEIAAFRRYFPDATVLEGDAGGVHGPLPAVHDEVRTRMPHHEILHFAGHGEYDLSDPSQSRLLLADHETNPFTVSSLSSVTLARAQLAYLSACNTGSPLSFGLGDESIHLASAFQVAGFTHVVSTLWEADDRTSVVVAERFYSCLGGSDRELDLGHTAQVLHRAVRAVREGEDRPGPARRRRHPFLWGPFIHVGP
jgi:tetratricopeptide (TPR) repeat protein